MYSFMSLLHVSHNNILSRKNCPEYHAGPLPPYLPYPPFFAHKAMLWTRMFAVQPPPCFPCGVTDNVLEKSMDEPCARKFAHVVIKVLYDQSFNSIPPSRQRGLATTQPSIFPSTKLGKSLGYLWDRDLFANKSLPPKICKKGPKQIPGTLKLHRVFLSRSR